MKTDIDTLKDLFEISYNAYEESREENKRVEDYYHNRQYTAEQIALLEKRGQPKETFNIIKMFGRLLVAYYSAVVNTVKVSPVQMEDKLVAMVLHDVVQFTFADSRFESEGDKIKLDGMLSGLMCVYEEIVETGKFDEYGRPIRRIMLSHVPSREILLDPMSVLDDYSDARFIHRFKWVSEDHLKSLIKGSGKNVKDIIERLESYYNFPNKDDTEFTENYNGQFQGLFKLYDNYLVVHSIIEDDNGKVWSILWSDDIEIVREEVTYREVRFPYRVQKINTSDKAEYYGLFREALERQVSINQAISKIQLLCNSGRAIVQKNAVEDLDEFTDSFNNVSGVISVTNLTGVKIENTSREVLEQYAIIDKALDRQQRELGITDAFLGASHASDSGRKVKLEQNSTVLALRYITVRLEQFYRLLGWDIVNLIKQYYTASEVIRIADKPTGERWIELNKPMQVMSNEVDANGFPIMRTVYEEVLDPASGRPLLDDEGRYLIAPIPERDTEIAFTDVDITVDTVPYNKEEEENRLLFDSILQGSIGNALMQYNPSGYLRAASLAIREVHTKHSHEIAEIMESTAAMLSQAQGQQLATPGEQPKITGASQRNPESVSNMNQGAR